MLVVSVAGLRDDGVAMEEEEEKCVDKRGKSVKRRMTGSRHTRETTRNWQKWRSLTYTSLRHSQELATTLGASLMCCATFSASCFALSRADETTRWSATTSQETKKNQPDIHEDTLELSPTPFHQQ